MLPLIGSLGLSRHLINFENQTKEIMGSLRSQIITMMIGSTILTLFLIDVIQFVKFDAHYKTNYCLITSRKMKQMLKIKHGYIFIWYTNSSS